MSYTIRPNVGDNLLNTRDPIRTNFEVIRDRFNENHEGINSGSGGGKHKFVQMPAQATAPTTAASEGALYTKNVSGVNQLFFRRESNGTEVQVTSGVTANEATFGTNTNYSGSNNGGWTYLPGGLIMMYGRFLTTSIGANVITYPFAFSSATYSVVATLEGTRNVFSVSNLATDKFTFNSEAKNQNVDWIAIGK